MHSYYRDHIFWHEFFIQCEIGLLMVFQSDCAEKKHKMRG